MKFRIAHLTSVHPRSDVRVFNKECVSLANHEFEVHLFVADGKGDEVRNGVVIHDIGVSPENRTERFLRTPQSIYRKTIEYNFNVYHIHDPELLSLTRKLKKHKAKVIYDIHEDVPRQILTKSYIPSFLKKSVSYLFERYENYMVKRVDYLIAATPHIYDRFIARNKNTGLIRNFPLLNELWIDGNERIKRNEICYIGGISEIRGINNILLAIKNKDVKFNLAGVFDTDGYKEQLIGDPSWNKVIYHGNLSRPEVQKLLGSSKIGLVTLLPMINFIDSLPVKLFEYMAAGLPVIASDFPLWKEIVEKNNCGLCVNPNNTEEISNAINYLLENEKIASEMGENGRKAIIEKFNWENEANKLISIYNELLARKT